MSQENTIVRIKPVTHVNTGDIISIESQKADIYAPDIKDINIAKFNEYRLALKSSILRGEINGVKVDPTTIMFADIEGAL